MEGNAYSAQMHDSSYGDDYGVELEDGEQTAYLNAGADYGGAPDLMESDQTARFSVNVADLSTRENDDDHPQHCISQDIHRVKEGDLVDSGANSGVQGGNLRIISEIFSGVQGGNLRIISEILRTICEISGVYVDIPGLVDEKSITCGDMWVQLRPIIINFRRCATPDLRRCSFSFDFVIADGSYWFKAQFYHPNLQTSRISNMYWTHFIACNIFCCHQASELGAIFFNIEAWGEILCCLFCEDGRSHYMSKVRLLIGCWSVTSCVPTWRDVVSYRYKTLYDGRYNDSVVDPAVNTMAPTNEMMCDVSSIHVKSYGNVLMSHDSCGRSLYHVIISDWSVPLRCRLGIPMCRSSMNYMKFLLWKHCNDMLSTSLDKLLGLALQRNVKYATSYTSSKVARGYCFNQSSNNVIGSPYKPSRDGKEYSGVISSGGLIRSSSTYYADTHVCMRTMHNSHLMHLVRSQDHGEPIVIEMEHVLICYRTGMPDIANVDWGAKVTSSVEVCEHNTAWTATSAVMICASPPCAIILSRRLPLLPIQLHSLDVYLSGNTDDRLDNGTSYQFPTSCCFGIRTTPRFCGHGADSTKISSCAPSTEYGEHLLWVIGNTFDVNSIRCTEDYSLLGIDGVLTQQPMEHGRDGYTQQLMDLAYYCSPHRRSVIMMSFDTNLSAYNGYTSTSNVITTNGELRFFAMGSDMPLDRHHEDILSSALVTRCTAASVAFMSMAYASCIDIYDDMSLRPRYTAYGMRPFIFDDMLEHTACITMLHRLDILATIACNNLVTLGDWHVRNSNVRNHQIASLHQCHLATLHHREHHHILHDTRTHNLICGFGLGHDDILHEHWICPYLIFGLMIGLIMLLQCATRNHTLQTTGLVISISSRRGVTPRMDVRVCTDLILICKYMCIVQVSGNMHRQTTFREGNARKSRW